MLRRLLIRDFVIVDTLELEFQGGFGALTGETGAGKSILIDALSLALGERADGAAVRTGRERAEVVAEFDAEPESALARWLADNDFAAEGAVCLMRRVVDAGGRSRAYINGTPTTLAQLKAAAECLADIHGQHAHQSLLRGDAQRQLLDGHAGLGRLAGEVAEAWRAWQRLREARERAEQDAEAGTRERELLEWQVKELENLAFDSQQWQEDNQEHSRLTHAASLMAAAEGAVEALDEGEMAATSLIDRVLGPLRELVDVDAALGEPLELIEGARIQLSEAAHALSRYRQRLDMDPARLAELEERLQAVMTLSRKHRVSSEELPELLERLSARLAELRLTADPAALAEHESAARQAFETLARRLTQGRTTAAATLSRQVTEAMQELAMAGGRFEIALLSLAQGASYGLENVEFQVSANAGQPLRPLAKVASGGELSRIGLAIQVIASQAGEVPTLIFDEVDVGIGGGVAEIVGRLLKQLGLSRQVLCVTHLPQVAAQADWQWSIAKETRNDQTLSRVTVLEGQGRIEEIARMLGGVKVTDTTRRHAQELLGSA
ncbi:DNA repair protein RecN [Denitratisoma oestradiolicum]|uniref:DNA repair protein RecN n=1 Tax=Denitratisoma oestradiolicum TaxID=311182 RepID=A0A6S6Y2R8_9PROT|nr:DNA repair protein RecN [Denitratisoma oestradiolicum]TWO79813.1 DNA repair protein RecN [Denitratisoma oestradiolicum]CAB1369506.1 recombination and repair protein [Denitratisoma oestradiolicum]